MLLWVCRVWQTPVPHPTAWEWSFSHTLISEWMLQNSLCWGKQPSRGCAGEVVPLMGVRTEQQQGYSRNWDKVWGLATWDGCSGAGWDGEANPSCKMDSFGDWMFAPNLNGKLKQHKCCSLSCYFFSCSPKFLMCPFSLGEKLGWLELVILEVFSTLIILWF